jgi:YD repeat-containing protein
MKGKSLLVMSMSVAIVIGLCMLGHSQTQTTQDPSGSGAWGAATVAQDPSINWNGYSIGDWVFVDGVKGFVGDDGNVWAVSGIICSCADLMTKADGGLTSGDGDGDGDGLPVPVKIGTGGGQGTGDVNASVDGRTVISYKYSGGVLVSSYNHDDDSTSIYVDGKVVRSFYNDAPNDPIFVGTYEKGRLVESVNQYGDVTYYDELGRKDYTTHTTADYDDQGNVIAGTQETNVVTKYNYDEYGRLSTVESKVAVADDDGNLTGDFEWQTSVYSYSGSQLLTVTNMTTGDVTHFNANETYVTSGVNGNVTQRTTTDPVTGRKATTYYDEETGAVTGTAIYDHHNQMIAAYDMDGNLTMSITYDGAHRAEQIAYVRDEAGNIVMTNTTYFDQWGNKTVTIQDSFSDSPDATTDITLETVRADEALVQYIADNEAFDISDDVELQNWINYFTTADDGPKFTNLQQLKIELGVY